MTPLRIVHVIARLNVGGAALHVLQLAREQARRGHTVIVVAGSLARGEESMEYVADELGVDIVKLPALQRELSVHADAAVIRRLRGLMRTWRPDVVHTHAAKAGATGRIAALLAGRGRPRTTVHTYHGHVLSGYFSPARQRFFRLVERLLARRTSALIAVSEEVKRDLIAYGVAGRDGVDVVPYGFDLAAPADDGARARIRAKLGIADRFLIGWAGRLTPIKRPLDLVRTLRAVRDEGVDAALVLVGDGEERPETEQLAGELGVREHVHLVGYQRNIRDWYAAFDVFVLTSLNEGTPVAAIEALAASRPVVATRAGGTATVVEDGETGFLVPVGDIAGLTTRVVELARDPALRERLGAAGERDVRRRFETRRMADEIEAIYRRTAP